MSTQFTEPITHHGEGAGWDPHVQQLRIVDLLAGDLLTVSSSGSAERLHVDTVAAAWRPRRDGGVVVATERGFRLVPPSGTDSWTTTAWSDPAVRMNDGACDPQGRFYCGTMAYDERPGAGSLWRLDPSREVTRVLDGFTIANGLVWSLDGSTVFHIDTPTGRIDGYSTDFTDRRTVATVTGGGPDGMTIDAEGGLWVALWGGSAVHRYDPSDGSLSAVVEVGATNVTSCAFGGPSLDQLFITTSREGAASDPAAGSVFVADVGVRGVPLHEFAG